MTRNDRPGEGRPIQGPGGEPDTPEGTALTLFEERSETGLALCDVCHVPTLRFVGSDGRPRHSWCEPSHAYLSAPDTSHAAARSVTKGPRSKVAQLVLATLERAGGVGLIDEEIAERLPSEHPGSCAKRRLDLVRAGLVRDSGRRRLTTRGRESIVWEVVR